ncbi:MAG: beta-ketoacyl-[acyl-carrier-protein] synthase family protein [Planctomycetales bacterium]|nr:beta-ketoacyl-[acyl-carrier-protein] synthase family protein [Planctomycetales bacterium]
MAYSRRVVVTGCGVISPLGNSVQELIGGLREGRTGIATFERIPVDALPVSFGGEARDFQENIEDFGTLEPAVKKQIRKGLKVMCREIKMGVAAAQRGLVDSGLDLAAEDHERIGVLFGSDYIATMPDEFIDPIRQCVTDGSFDFEQWAESGLPKVTPLWLLKYLPNMPACHVAIYNDLRGASNSITMREASSNLAVAEATTTIARGMADVIVAGATGCRIHPLRSVHTVLQETLAAGVSDPADACRPFDRDRQGSVLGEGAAVVILESLDHAQQRGATIIGEILGHGSSAVMDQHFVPLPEKALVNAMRQSIALAGVEPGDVGHVHAHGLGTKDADVAEASAIRTVFSGRDSDVPVVAAKGSFGNLGACSGLVELIASLHALNDGTLFPARNYQHPDDACSINVVTSDSIDAGSTVLNLSATPQGQASVILAGRFAA